MTSDVQWQNYLTDVTNAIQTHETVDAVRARYGISHKEDKDLIDLIERLDGSMRVVQPSTQFANRLKDDLLGTQRTGVVWRIRRLPARVQWAAIVTAIIGGVLIVVQRLVGAGNKLHSEERTRIPDEG